VSGIKPRGGLPGYSDQPAPWEEYVFDQPEFDVQTNQPAEIGARVPEAFGVGVRVVPRLMCQPLVSHPEVGLRDLERWFVVAAGEYFVSESYIGTEVLRGSTYYDTHLVVSGGGTGLPARLYTKELDEAVDHEIVNEGDDALVSPESGDWSSPFILPASGGGIDIVGQIETDPIDYGFGLYTGGSNSEDAWELEVEITRTDTGTQVLEQIDVTEGTGVPGTNPVPGATPNGGIRQWVINNPISGGPVAVRLRLNRYHSNQIGVGPRTLRIVRLGSRVRERQVQAFPGFMTMYVKLVNIPDDDWDEVSEAPISVVLNRRPRQWDATSVKFGVTNEEDVTDAIVQTLADAGRSGGRYLDTASLANVRGSLTGSNAGRLRMVFDERMSIEDQLRTLCDHHRIIPVMVGSLLSFSRDERRDPRTLFTARQKLAPETETVQHRDPDAADGVRVEFFDRSRETSRSAVYPETSLQRNLVELNLPGLSTWEQAFKRARFEWAKLTNRRREATFTFTEEARWLRPGDRIIVADSIVDPGTYSDGWGRLNVDGGAQVLIEDPDVSVHATTPGSVIYVRSPHGLVYHVAGATYASAPPRIIMASTANFDRPPAGAQQSLPFILGDQFGSGGVEDQLTWIVAEVADGREGEVEVTAFRWVDIYGVDWEPVPVDPWDAREPVDEYETDVTPPT
jgi:hypothetical protein